MSILAGYNKSLGPMAWESLETCSCIMQYVLLLGVFGVLGMGVFRKIPCRMQYMLLLKEFRALGTGIFGICFMPNLVQVWSRCGAGMAWARSRYGAGMV